MIISELLRKKFEPPHAGCYIKSAFQQPMNRTWTPKSDVSVTDAGMVIKIELDGMRPGSLRPTFKEGHLCIRGEHEAFGLFETKIAIPEGYNAGSLKMIVQKKILRIEVPPGKYVPFLSQFPKSMLIYCNGCGKHFDIIITGKGPGNYPCPACGKVQIFDLEALVNQVLEQGKQLPGKKRGRR
jgi:HSP20 family molecular chaperone IbpA/predicted RNA-binding Zn-ribbon protein involved in translation (DUF1610 family)